MKGKNTLFIFILPHINPVTYHHSRNKYQVNVCYQLVSSPKDRRIVGAFWTEMGQRSGDREKHEKQRVSSSFQSFCCLAENKQTGAEISSDMLHI